MRYFLRNKVSLERDIYLGSILRLDRVNTDFLHMTTVLILSFSFITFIYPDVHHHLSAYVITSDTGWVIT